jgi:hypothetical protein
MTFPCFQLFTVHGSAHTWEVMAGSCWQLECPGELNNSVQSPCTSYVGLDHVAHTSHCLLTCISTVTEFVWNLSSSSWLPIYWSHIHCNHLPSLLIVYSNEIYHRSSLGLPSQNHTFTNVVRVENGNGQRKIMFYSIEDNHGPLVSAYDTYLGTAVLVRL